MSLIPFIARAALIPELGQFTAPVKRLETQKQHLGLVRLEIDEILFFQDIIKLVGF